MRDIGNAWASWETKDYLLPFTSLYSGDTTWVRSSKIDAVRDGTSDPDRSGCQVLVGGKWIDLADTGDSVIAAMRSPLEHKRSKSAAPSEGASKPGS